MDRNVILDSVRDYCEIPEDDPDFDDRLIDHINGEFAKLFQNGAGPNDGFAISTGTELWSDFSANVILQSMVREFIKSGTKLAFDPPQSTAHLEAMKARYNELEWRIREYPVIATA